MNRCVTFILPLLCAVISKAELWLHVELTDSRSADLELFDGMSLDFNAGRLAISGHNAMFDIRKVAGFHYIEKEDFYVNAEVIDVADKAIISIYDISGYKINECDDTRALTSGILYYSL